MNHQLQNHFTRSLITISPDESVEKALMVMKNHHIRHLVVKAENGQVIGILSDRDVYRAFSAEEKNVANIMSKHLLQFDIKTPMQRIVTEMIDRKVSAFLVTSQSEVIGIITSEDLLYLTAELLKEDKPQKTLLENFVDALKEVPISPITAYG
jgi:acetoin utilization protein AcuB